MKLLILIDGDNIDESFAPVIYKEALSLLEVGDVFEFHCFGDFVKRKQTWRDAYYLFGIQPHYIPGMDKQKGKPDPNTSDIALTAFAVKMLYTYPELETVIIVANDKDYAPLAKIIMEEHSKSAVMFYTQSNDTAAACYTRAVLLKANKPNELPGVEAPQAATLSKKEKSSELSVIIKCIESKLASDSVVLLAELGPLLIENGVSYGKSLGNYLEDKFTKYEFLKDLYVLKRGDKKDRIERKAD